MIITRTDSQVYPYPPAMTWFLILIMAIAIQYVCTIYFVTMRTRLRVFTPEFMEQFRTEHATAFPDQKMPQFGYPDCGNGRYGKKLAYADWYAMNNAQRAQGNFLEQITFITMLSVVSAIGYPWVSIALFAAYQVGRAIFTIFYAKSGPNSRIAGALIMDVAILGQLGLSIASIVQICQQTK